MHITQRMTGALASAAMVAGTLLLAAAPASAGTPNCPSTTPANGVVAGVVTQGARDWWYNDGSGTRTFTLRPLNGDADLYVYGSDCSSLLCSSAAGTLTPDVCTITYTGRVQIAVYGYSVGDVAYALEAPLAPSASGFASDDCTTGTLVAQGFAGPNYVRMHAVRPNSDTTWVCVRTEGPSLAVGGKFVVTGPGATLPPLPSTDSNVAACAAPGNAVPGPHPMLSGSIGDPSDPPTYLPYLLDSHATTGGASVCVKAGTFAVRAQVYTGLTVSPPSVTFVPDPAGSHTQPAPAAPGTPSGTCQNGAGTVDRYLDMSASGTRTFLYTWRPSASVLKLCVRTTGLASAGGVLTVDSTNLNGALPTVTTGSNITGCTLSMAKVDQLGVEVRRSGASLPVSACVTVGSTTVRVTAASGNGSPPVSVTWTPDPGTP